MNKFCSETGVWLIPWGLLSQGQLARPHHVTGSATRSSEKPALPEADVSIIYRVEELAKKRNWKMGHVSLAWLNYKGISSPIGGFNSVARLDDALDARRKKLTAEEVISLEEQNIPKNIFGRG